MLVSVTSSSAQSSKASIQRFAHNYLTEKRENAPNAIKALVSIMLGETLTEPIEESEADNLCVKILPFSCLRSMIPAVKVLPLRSGA